MKFHRYERVPPAADIHILLAEIEANPTHIFWGRARSATRTKRHDRACARVHPSRQATLAHSAAIPDVLTGGFGPALGWPDGRFELTIRGRSKLWLLSAALIVGGATVYAAAVTLYWRPCAGSILNGSVLHGYRYESEFSNYCLVAMGQAPGFHLPEPGARIEP